MPGAHLDDSDMKHAFGAERSCTCHPDDKPPSPCARKFALRDCRIADIARRIRYAADMVGDDELPQQIHALARELETT